MRIFNTVEREQERMLPICFRHQKIFDPEEFSLLHHGQHTLVRVRAGEPGKLIARFKGDTDPRRAAQFDQSFQAIVPALAGDADMVELA